MTIKEIAQLSGVSRGTVDRVLHHRGRVSPEKEAKVLKVAAQLGYKPNTIGKALAARQKSYAIGVLLTAQGVSFFDEVLRGISAGAEELADYGVSVIVRSIKGYDPAVQLQEMEALKPQVNALILNPINDPIIVEEINRMAAEGLEVVTLNTDVEGSRRLCYVGPDYFRSGQAACGIMGMLLQGKGALGLLTGSVRILGHNQRMAGIRAVLRERFPQITVADFGQTNDDDVEAFAEASRMLREHPEITGLILVAAGSYGVCRAVEALPPERRPLVVAMDLVPTTVEMMKKGIIQAAVCQQPFFQGQQAVRVAFRRLVQGEIPPTQRIFTETEIRILETLF